ncbi:MAG: NPCBM/NEW2 domain-containing protein [Clostridia bacterium]|nr:NPCBM/NEW2 domain-containing protein [Clostridia bacterium]
MKKRLQGLIAGVLIGAMLTSGVVFAKSGPEIIEALYNDIKIYVDGEKIEPKDATGKTVEPFIYNGTTYLPVRAIGEAIEKDVNWDGSSHSVYIGKMPGKETYLTDICPAYEFDEWRYEECTSNNGKNFSMAGELYTRGFTVTPYNCESVISLYNLNGQYNTLSFTAGHVDGTANQNLELRIYADNELIKIIKLKHNQMPSTYNVNLSGALQLKIEAVNPEGDTWAQATYGIANAIIE